MATSSKIHLSPSQHPTFFVNDISTESAATASELLQENHEKYHIFFNKFGFHNHIVHMLLTLYSLSASPAELKTGYANNTSYQRPLVPLGHSVIDDLHLKERFKAYLGDEQYYHDYLVFFKGEIDRIGWEDVLNEYVFKGDERADDMLVRLFSGFLHPFIHLGLGIEFAQPAIIAEALAQASVHDSWIEKLFHASEKARRATNPDQHPTKSLVQLLDEIRQDKKLSGAAHLNDGNKIRDGLLKRAPEEMIKYASQYFVRECDLEEKTAEMINAAVYFTSTSQDPPHIPKFDFYYIHCVNASIFSSVFLSAPWLSTANKIRLLEWKGRQDLAMYASRGSPPLLLDEVTQYKSKKDGNWDDIFKRAIAFGDDGHASKLVRALAHGEKVCKPYENQENFVIKGEMWRVLGNMAMDSVEAGGPTWVRNAGFEEAWVEVPERGSRL